MEILSNQLELVNAELSNYRSKYAPLLAILARCKTVGDCMETVLETVGGLINDSSFCSWHRDFDDYSKIVGLTFRYFNGRYYDCISERFVQQGVRKFLMDGGLNSTIVLRMGRAIDEQVRTYCLMKRLQPRMTLMCFQNGVVDFSDEGDCRSTFKYPPLRPFGREYDVIKQYDFDYDPTAHRNKCRLWKNFLGYTTNFQSNIMGVLPDRLKRQQLQMFLGSTLMDRRRNSFEHFMILQGDGANGKSVIFRVIRDLFGSEEVTPMDLSQFVKSGDERLRAASNLEGKRLMFSPEDVSSKRAFQFIKQIASGETISARRIGGNIREVEVIPILMLNTNHRWTVGDIMDESEKDDKSILRRVQILNFEHTIPASQRDTMLSEKLKAEKTGIFSWILVGWRNLKMNGYRMPENRQDQINLILEKARHSCKVGDKSVSGALVLYLERKGIESEEKEGYTEIVLRSKDIYENFSAFCHKENFPVCSLVKFGRDMLTMGHDRIKKEKNAGGDNLRYYRIWVKDRNVARNFNLHVPELLDEAMADLFEGNIYEDDEFDDGSSYVD